MDRLVEWVESDWGHCVIFSLFGLLIVTLIFWQI
jgi:hypothetical protein